MILLESLSLSIFTLAPSQSTPLSPFHTLSLDSLFQLEDMILLESLGIDEVVDSVPDEGIIAPLSHNILSHCHTVTPLHCHTVNPNFNLS